MLLVELPCLLICAALFLAVSSAEIESKHGGAWNLFMDRVRIKEGSSNVPVLGGLLDSFGGLDSRRLSTLLQTLPLPSVLSQRSLSPRPVSAPLSLSSPPIPLRPCADRTHRHLHLPCRSSAQTSWTTVCGSRGTKTTTCSCTRGARAARAEPPRPCWRSRALPGRRGRRRKRRAGQDLSFVCLLVCWGPVLFVLTFSFRFPP